MNEEISRIDINNVNYKLKDEDTRVLGEMGKQALIKVGYYVCSTQGSTAAKTISAADYTLSVGGCIKVKMDNANTAENATLNINSTGAKPLYYDGNRASATNTWKAGETVEVYYDGTNYMANSVVGGGIGIDDIPNIASDNTVKSSGIQESIDHIFGRADNFVNGRFITSNGGITGPGQNLYGYGINKDRGDGFFPCIAGDKITWHAGGTARNICICFYSDDNTESFIQYFANTSQPRTVVAPTGAVFFRFSYTVAGKEIAYVAVNGKKIWKPADALQGDLPTAIDAVESLVKNGIVGNCIKHKYLNYLGNEVSDNDFGISDYIPYSAGDGDIVWAWGMNGPRANMCLIPYDSNKTPIGGNAYWTINSINKSRTIESSSMSTIAPNVAFIRVTFNLSFDSTSPAYVTVNGTKVWDAVINFPSNYEVDDRLTVLEKERSTDEVSYLNRHKNSAINAIATKIGTQIPTKIQDNYLCILHCSDFHNDAVRFKRMIGFANSHKNIIKAILVTGDTCAQRWSDAGFENVYVANYQNTTLPILPVIGNHDVGFTTEIYTDNPNTNQAVGARFVTPYINRIGGVQGGTDAGYYYKDFSSYNIRLIVLNEYELPRVPNSDNTALKYSIWYRYISQAQAYWLVNTLANTPQNYSVIISMHQVIDAPMTQYDNEFKSLGEFSAGCSSDSQNGLIQDIVDAFISKATLTKTYSVSWADSSEVPDVNVNANFTSANGEFMCYICGHSHYDGTGQSGVADNKQVCIGVTSAGPGDHYDDLYRVTGDISEDCFDLLAFDTDKKQIRMLRIGANISADMRRRDYACVPYAQPTT